jgi:hypothetical protein
MLRGCTSTGTPFIAALGRTVSRILSFGGAFSLVTSTVYDREVPGATVKGVVGTFDVSTSHPLPEPETDKLIGVPSGRKLLVIVIVCVVCVPRGTVSVGGATVRVRGRPMVI